MFHVYFRTGSVCVELSDKCKAAEEVYLHATGEDLFHALCELFHERHQEVYPGSSMLMESWNDEPQIRFYEITCPSTSRRETIATVSTLFIGILAEKWYRHTVTNSVANTLCRALCVPSLHFCIQRSTRSTDFLLKATVAFMRRHPATSDAVVTHLLSLLNNTL